MCREPHVTCSCVPSHSPLLTGYSHLGSVAPAPWVYGFPDPNGEDPWQKRASENEGYVTGQQFLRLQTLYYSSHKMMTR
jgi:hypothetical protein